MSDRGLPIADSALACPFIAFEDDREGRALSPDGRHRCYAEVRPAPRAMAHQEAYCLTSAFSVCPTFLDWARREAAQTRPAPVADPLVQEAAGRAEPAGAGEDAGPTGDATRRNPPRDWLSPPPWMTAGTDDESEGHEDADHESEVKPVPLRGGGLSGSFADRILVDAPALEPSATWVPPAPQPPIGDPRVEQPAEPDDDEDEEDARPAKADRSSRNPRSGQGREASRGTRSRIAPSWERPPRREAYPTLKTRIGLGQLTVSPILFWIIALAIAVVVLFSLPAILGIGNPPAATTAPSPSASASGLAASSAPEGPTPIPAPSAQTYVVQAGDTMSRIANRFGIPLQFLIDANKEAIPDPDKLQLGQEVLIPLTTPTLLPNEAPSPSP
ncbi:MAG: LysM domain-containing protein [Candidatus Limnocylindrales bacterium]